jgi:hypothetical protein
MTPLKTLPLAIALLTAASGCELLSYDAGLDPAEDFTPNPDGAPPVGSAPLYPFTPGGIWQYTITNADGSTHLKTVAIDAKPVMVGGTGPHQLDMAYAVRTSYDGRPPSITTMQQAVGDQIVNWREQTFDPQGQLVVEVSWDPQQLEVDQSKDRTRAGASWQEKYLEVTRPYGGIAPTTVTLNETWTMKGEETLTLPGVGMSFPCLVFQRTAMTGGGSSVGDGGTPVDAGVSRPMLTGQGAVDGGAGLPNIPKTLWYARGYGKVKEAGGGQPTEELSALRL